MAKVICVMGESGSGKTTSCRNLNPKETFYVDADRKGLSWRGWKEHFNSASKNYKQTSDVYKIREIMQGISDNASHVKIIVVDTINTIMADDEIRRMKEHGYDKWQDLAMCIWDLISEAHMLRDDMTVIFIGHTQTERDDSGIQFTRLKTNGKKLDKLTLESKFTTVLLSKCVDGKHVFEVHANKSTAKTPMGAYSTPTAENDMAKVLEVLADY